MIIKKEEMIKSLKASLKELEPEDISEKAQKILIGSVFGALGVLVGLGLGYFNSTPKSLKPLDYPSKNVILSKSYWGLEEKYIQTQEGSYILATQKMESMDDLRSRIKDSRRLEYELKKMEEEFYGKLEIKETD